MPFSTDASVRALLQQAPLMMDQTGMHFTVIRSIFKRVVVSRSYL